MSLGSREEDLAKAEEEWKKHKKETEWHEWELRTLTNAPPRETICAYGCMYCDFLSSTWVGIQ